MCSLTRPSLSFIDMGILIFGLIKAKVMLLDFCLQYFRAIQHLFLFSYWT